MSLIRDFLKRRAIDAQADKLATQFTNRLPAAVSKEEKRFTSEFEIVLGHLQGFHRKEKLGTFGKARLINSFQWSLINKGYDADLARKLGREIASRLTTLRPNSSV